jgi:2-methylfumaryl-CoA isomerase
MALKDVAAAMLGNLGILGEVMVNGVDRPKYGNALYGAYGQDFLCADGQRVMVIGLTDRQWRGLCSVTGSAEAMAALGARLGLDLSQEGNRFIVRKEITAVLAPWFAARRVADFAAAFDTEGLTWSVFRSFKGAMAEDPDVSTANPMFSMVDQPGLGRYLAPSSPMVFTGAEREAAAPAPVLGQHTEEILADVMRLPAGEIAALFDKRVVAGPRA